MIYRKLNNNKLNDTPKKRSNKSYFIRPGGAFIDDE